MGHGGFFLLPALVLVELFWVLPVSILMLLELLSACGFVPWLIFVILGLDKCVCVIDGLLPTLQAQFSQMRPMAMAPSVAPRMQMYPPGGPGLGQQIFYGQAPPAIIPSQVNRIPVLLHWIFCFTIFQFFFCCSNYLVFLLLKYCKVVLLSHLPLVLFVSLDLGISSNLFLVWDQVGLQCQISLCQCFHRDSKRSALVAGVLGVCSKPSSQFH